MPIMVCELPGGGKGFKWGQSGKCYADRKDAERQAAAAHANGYTGDSAFAFDISVRTKDADGRLHISRTHISKATVNPYYGREIPGYERLGLDPDKVYRLLRHPDELAKGAHTFARLPILKTHVIVSADDIKPEYIAGAIGSLVEFADPYLDADVCIWDADDIEGIENDTVRQFSCSYRYVPVMTPGTYQGMEYDGIMTEIIGNHLALVEAGRAGSDVLAADEDSITMKMTKAGKALYLALGAMSPKVAADSTLAGLVGKATGKTAKAEELAPKIVAMDSELDAEKVRKTVAALLALDAEKKEDRAEDEEEDDEMDGAEDEEEETEEERKKREAKDKKARDKRAKDEEKEKEKAMDAKLAAATDALKQQFREADEARRLVRPVVGDVIAQDSAEGIYGFALDHLKVPREGVTGVPALRALFNAANKPASSAPLMATDAAGASEMFPDLNRIGRR